METTLLSPLVVRGLALPNRIVMPPMANNKATIDGEVTPDIVEHYLRHAGGLGMIVVEHAYVTVTGRLNPNQLGIHSDANVPGLAGLAGAIRRAGVPSAIQITHGGGRTTAAVCGSQPEGPSAGLQVRAREAARELGEHELGSLRDAFAAAAARAKAAGFDAVELHGAHGYLLNQFYSPLTNHRSDAYGGSRDARLRFPLEVLRAVRSAVGAGYPVLYRLGADDLIEGGITPADGAYAAAALAESGADLIDLSGGLGGSAPAGPADREGYFDYLGRAVKAAARVPVMVTGGIRTARAADRLVRSGAADLVGVGRALLANPAWAVQALAELTS
jgi:2,4-dienoyl-CoA reductase-like NADH-dependent reductase (Old Yellow Enzyme family)